MPLTRQRADVEMWWRNPQFYIQQCVEVGTFSFTWDRRYLYKRRLDSRAYVSMYARGNPWRSLVIDDHYAVLYDSKNPGHVATWPVWSAETQSWRELINLIGNPWADEAFDDQFPYPAPNAHQQHVIVISDLPSSHLNSNKDFYSDLKLIQEDHPEVTFFIHGSYSMKMLCDGGFRMGDFEPRTAASSGSVHVHGGRKVHWDEVPAYWANLFGYQVSDLRSPAVRCTFNIETTLWNAAYWNSTKRFAVRKGKSTDPLETFIRENHLIFTKRIAQRPGDRVACDDCSLWLHCKYFREGSVCAVPHTDMDQIAKLFGTRRSDDIIKGLGKMLEVQVERAQEGMKAEAEGDEKRAPGQIDPALNKLMNDIQNGAVKLLELVDPQYRKQVGKVQVAINTGGAPAQASIGPGDPAVAARELTSRAYSALLEQGFTAEDIEADPSILRGMIQTMLQPAIESS
jgi:hypothetical protein